MSLDHYPLEVGSTSCIACFGCRLEPTTDHVNAEPGMTSSKLYHIFGKDSLAAYLVSYWSAPSVMTITCRAEASLMPLSSMARMAVLSDRYKASSPRAHRTDACEDAFLHIFGQRFRLFQSHHDFHILMGVPNDGSVGLRSGPINWPFSSLTRCPNRITPTR